MKRYLIPSALLIFLITAIASWLVISSGFYSISGDESARTLISYYWFKSGVLQSSTWLPLHFIIMGAGFYIYPDLILLPRIISITAGLLVIASTGWLAFYIFRNTAVTVIAIILCAFLPQRLILSLLPLPEIIYIFFIITGSVFLIRWVREKKPSYLIITAVLWSIPALLRYESWLFIAVLCVYAFLLYNKNMLNWRMLLTIVSISALLPSGWIIYDYISTKELFSFFNEPQQIYRNKFGSGIMSLFHFNPLYQLIEQNLFSLNITGAAGVFLLRKEKTLLKWLTLLFIPLLLFSIISITGSSLPAHNFWRTASVWSIFLVPFTAYVIHYIAFEIYPERKKAIVTIIISVLLVQFSFSSFNIIKSNSSRYSFSESDLKAGELFAEYIRASEGGKSKVLIENTSSYQHLHLMLASRDPYKFIYSERNSLVPVNESGYRNTPINFYLVRSAALKQSLSVDKTVIKVLEYNDWYLYKTDNPSQ